MLWLAITHQPHWQPVVSSAWPGKTKATETRGREWRNGSERKRKRRRERKWRKYPGKLLYNWRSLSEPYFMCMSRAGQPSRPHWNPTLTGAVPRPSHLPAEESRLHNTLLLTAGLLCVCVSSHLCVTLPGALFQGGCCFDTSGVCEVCFWRRLKKIFFFPRIDITGKCEVYHSYPISTQVSIIVFNCWYFMLEYLAIMSW